MILYKIQGLSKVSQIQDFRLNCKIQGISEFFSKLGVTKAGLSYITLPKNKQIF